MAAHVLDLSERQLSRLFERIRTIEDRGDPCALLVFTDFATGKLRRTRFVRSESAFSYFEALELYLSDHGAPSAFYPDRHSLFWVASKDAKVSQDMTRSAGHFRN
jgi:hypothetical protein